MAKHSNSGLWIAGIIVVVLFLLGGGYGIFGTHWKKVSFNDESCVISHLTTKCDEASPIYDFGQLEQLNPFYRYHDKDGIRFWEDEVKYSCRNTQENRLYSRNADMNALQRACS